MAFKAEPGPKCPVCQNEGRSTSLELYQVNLTEAVYLCKLGDCTYPKGHSWIFVNRSVFNTSDSDSDSDSCTTVEFKSIPSTRCSNIRLNVVQNEKEDYSVVNKAVTRPSNAEYKEKNLPASAGKVLNSAAVDNDLLISNDNVNINSKVIDAIEPCNSEPELGISSEAVDLRPDNNTNLFDIESIPVVFAESDEGKQLLESEKQSSECISIIIEPLTQNMKIVSKRNELTSKKIIPIKPTKKCERDINKERDVNKETNNSEQVTPAKKSFGQLLPYERHAVLWDIQKKCDKMSQNRNSKAGRLPKRKYKEKCSKPKEKHVNRIPEAIVEQARAILRKKEIAEKLKQEQCNKELQQEKLNAENISDSRISKETVSDMKSAATCFEGDKFSSVDIKSTGTAKKNEKESKIIVSHIKEDKSAITPGDSVNTDVTEVEFNLDETLNTFFHNIDAAVPMNNAVDNEDVDDWLKSLCPTE